MRLIPLYLLLIGAPALGVLGLLRMGRDLTPPISIKGTWTTEIVPQAPGEQPCEEALRLNHKTLTISQSGLYLLLKFDDEKGTTLNGQIQNTTVTAEARHRSTASTNEQNDAAAISIHANLDRQQLEPERLRGELTLDGCPPGIKMAFIATRK
jgi:hypothetical protein